MHKSISQKTYVTSLADRITKPHVGHGGLVQLSQEDGNFSYSFCFSAARSKLNKWWASSSFVCVRTFRGFCFVSSLPLCSVVIKDLLVFNPIDRSGGVCVYPYIYETGPTIYKHKGLCNRYVVPIHNSPGALERAVWRNLGHMPGTCRVWSASRTPTDAPAILSDNSPQQSDAYSVVRETDSWSSGYLDFLRIFFLSFFLFIFWIIIKPLRDGSTDVASFSPIPAINWLQRCAFGWDRRFSAALYQRPLSAGKHEKSAKFDRVIFRWAGYMDSAAAAAATDRYSLYTPERLNVSRR